MTLRWTSHPRWYTGRRGWRVLACKAGLDYAAWLVAKP